MTTEVPPPTDAAGDPPCWAHLFEEEGHAPAPPTDVGDPLGGSSWAELADQLAEAVLVADRSGTITYWNRSAERLFGWEPLEAVGATLDLIIPERHRDRHWDGYARTVATGVTRYSTQLLEVPAMHRDGRTVSIAFTLTVLTDVEGRVSRLVAVVRDDTERWQERRRLRAELRAANDSGVSRHLPGTSDGRPGGRAH
jgi:PAS domain S-box-containing protein